MRHYVWETTVLEFGELCVLSASRPKSQEVCGMHLANSPLLMYYKSDWLGGADLLSGWNQSQAHLVDLGSILCSYNGHDSPYRLNCHACSRFSLCWHIVDHNCCIYGTQRDAPPCLEQVVVSWATLEPQNHRPRHHWAFAAAKDTYPWVALGILISQSCRDVFISLVFGAPPLYRSDEPITT